MNSRSLLPIAALVAALGTAAPAAAAPQPLELKLLGRSASVGEGGTEIAAYQAASRRAYVTNAEGNSLDV